MVSRKTLINWLTGKYSLIIRNEEDFSEKTTLSFNNARLIVFLIIFGLIILSIAVFLVTVLLNQWLDPRHVQMVANRQILEHSVRIDSLEREVENRSLYLENIRKILSGELLDDSTDLTSDISIQSPTLSQTIQPIDSQFRTEFEGTYLSNIPINVTTSSNDLKEIYLFSPLDGIVTDVFDPRKNHYGTDLVAKENEPVRCVADGVVILSSWTLDGGYVVAVQHSGELISIYKHNSELFKNVGSFVEAGEVIATIGNSGELTSGPHLHLELWLNGNPVNPQEYIAF